MNRVTGLLRSVDAAESDPGRCFVLSAGIQRFIRVAMGRVLVGIGLIWTVTGCAAGSAPASGPGVPEIGEATPRLPPVPDVRGDLRIDVVHPPAGAIIAPESTFIYGSLGRGDAELSINGTAVEVALNGAWLAYLPVPADGRYLLTARAGVETVTEELQIRRPEPTPPIDGALRILERSITLSGPVTGTAGERLEIRFRGTPGASARILMPDGSIIPMIEEEAIDRASGFMLDRVEQRAEISEYVGWFELTSTIAPIGSSIDAPTLLAEEELAAARAAQGDAPFAVELERGNQFVQVPIAAAIGVLDPERPRVAVAATTRPDSTVIGRRGRGADQAWEFFWPNGTLLTIDGEREGYYRVRLAENVSAWVVAGDVRLLPPGTPPASGFVGPSIQLTRTGDGVAVRFNTSQRLPFRVVPGEWGLTVEFYGALGRPAYIGYGGTDEFVSRVDWRQENDELYAFDIRLTRPLWGFRTRWEGNALLLDVREPPTVSAANPLRGLRIGIDAGHRGSVDDMGAIGPTRLAEVDVTAALAERMVAHLRGKGADVIEIRPAATIVPLIDRPIMATTENVHLFVSLHFNAFPDGVDPFANHGTSMFYFWPHSLRLARALQREIVSDLALPDRGVRFQNLAITRTTWMPAVLTEPLYMMFPQQEAALRDPSFLDRLAQAHVRGIEEFVRERSSAGAPGESIR